MLKRIVSVCMVTILVFSIYGCAQTAVNTPVAVTGNVEAENADAENVEAVEGEITSEEIISEDQEGSDITNEKAKSEDEEDIDKTDERSLTEEKVSVAIDTDNPYFFRQSLLTADAKYFSVTEVSDGRQHEETVNAEVSLVKSYEEGDVYKFTIDIISDYFSTWYIQGGEPINMYFYVTPDKIYLVSRYVQTEPDGTAHYYFGGDELVTEILDTDEKLVNNSLIVCQEEETEDNTENEQYSLTTNNKENEHYSISKNGNQILCYYYQLRASGDLLYRDKFLWEKGKGLVVYLTGYGVGDYDIYLDCITGVSLSGQEDKVSESTDAPTDMLLRNPEYEGQIGYICEYDSIEVVSKKAYYKADGDINHRYEYEYDGKGNMTKEIFHSGSYSKWEEWEYDDAGNVTKEIDHDFDGSIFTKSEYEYDGAGNKTKQSYYSANFGTRRDEWEYDNAGNQVKHICYAADDNVDWWHEYEYDSAGNRVKYIEYNGDGSIYEWAEWEYDNRNNMIKYMKYKWGEVDKWEEYEYDDEKNLTKETYYNPDGSIDCRCVYEYDNERNLTEKTWYNADGSVDSRGEYGYDSAGNETKCIIYAADGSIIVGSEYEYDSAGNQTKRITYNADGSIGYMYGYEYEYDSRGNKTKKAIFDYSDYKYTVWFEWVYDNMDNVTKYTYYHLGEVQECEEYEYISIAPQ